MTLTSKQQQLLEFVKIQHGDQKRKYIFTPYWEHPLSVAERVSKYVQTPNTIEIALCHDLFEDTKCTLEQLSNELIRIGYHWTDTSDILNGVRDLTDEFTKEVYPLLNRKERKERETIRLGGINPRSQSIKLADLVDNTSTIVKYDPSFAKTYLEEKLQILDKMRQGNIHLLVECCYTLQSAMNTLQYEKI